MKRPAVILSILFSLLAFAIAVSVYEYRRLDALDRKLFPYEYEPRPKAKFKTNREALAAEDPVGTGCRVLRARVKNKRIADLTVAETEALDACRTLGQ